MAMIYTPQPDTLAAKLCSYFVRNPSEELSVDDIVSKFGHTRCHVHTQLRPALDAELLTRVRNADADYIYSAGPMLLPQSAKRGRPANAPAPTLPASPPTHPKPTMPKTQPSRPRPMIDISAIQIDDGIPISQRLSRTRKWHPLFEKLQPGQSCALPLHAKAALAKQLSAMKKTGPARYTVRTFPDTQTLRLWRTA